jgi:5-oxopent-3-ene-1,2,5-tricarboxylate decarboxylase/2-hydroxyhepta-2,4-diene-1,7-dioate isomerase
MKIARFAAQGRVHTGRWEDEQLVDGSGRPHDPDSVTWLPPVTPTKVIGLALNYADHAAELSLQTPEDPALFFKPLSSLIGHRAAVVYPTGAQYMHYECELAVVIGQTCRRVRAERALDVVQGYTIANDITVRDFVTNTFRPPVKGKGWDTFGPIGPFLTTADQVPNPADVNLRTFVNGELRQSGNTSLLVRSIGEIIEYITFFMTLEAGDVLLTGTPKGLSHVYPGDLMRLEIDGLGVLENPIIADRQPD